MDIASLDMTFITKSIMIWLPRISAALLILFGFYVAGQIVIRLLRKAMQRMGHDEYLSNLLIRTVRIVIIIVAIITALGTLGVDVSALVASLGLTGFAVGFALKDTISNLLSGVLVLLHKPFIVGDEITISGFTGKVVMIDLRYTELLTEENKILIPNSKLFTDPVTVNTSSTS